MRVLSWVFGISSIFTLGFFQTRAQDPRLDYGPYLERESVAEIVSELSNSTQPVVAFEERTGLFGSGLTEIGDRKWVSTTDEIFKAVLKSGECRRFLNPENEILRKIETGSIEGLSENQRTRNLRQLRAALLDPKVQQNFLLTGDRYFEEGDRELAISVWKEILNYVPEERIDPKIKIEVLQRLAVASPYVFPPLQPRAPVASWESASRDERVLAKEVMHHVSQAAGQSGMSLYLLSIPKRVGNRLYFVAMAKPSISAVTYLQPWFVIVDIPSHLKRETSVEVPLFKAAPLFHFLADRAKYHYTIDIVEDLGEPVSELLLEDSKIYFLIEGREYIFDLDGKCVGLNQLDTHSQRLQLHRQKHFENLRTRIRTALRIGNFPAGNYNPLHELETRLEIPRSAIRSDLEYLLRNHEAVPEILSAFWYSTLDLFKKFDDERVTLETAAVDAERVAAVLEKIYWNTAQADWLKIDRLLNVLAELKKVALKSDVYEIWYANFIKTAAEYAVDSSKPLHLRKKALYALSIRPPFLKDFTRDPQKEGAWAAFLAVVQDSRQPFAMRFEALKYLRAEQGITPHEKHILSNEKASLIYSALFNDFVAAGKVGMRSIEYDFLGMHPSLFQQVRNLEPWVATTKMVMLIQYALESQSRAQRQYYVTLAAEANDKWYSIDKIWDVELVQKILRQRNFYDRKFSEKWRALASVAHSNDTKKLLLKLMTKPKP